MSCSSIKISNQNTEPYQDCLSGVTVPKGYICFSDGKAYILKKGSLTQAINLYYNFSRKSFYESDQAVLKSCQNYQTTNPNAEVVCALMYHGVKYSPQR